MFQRPQKNSSYRNLPEAEETAASICKPATTASSDDDDDNNTETR
jgi:hypothetical protein